MNFRVNARRLADSFAVAAQRRLYRLPDLFRD
jgi:hypothetical protein